MKSAVLHSKVPLSEDLLTAAFADVLRIHQENHLIDALLGISSIAGEDGRVGRDLRSGLRVLSWSHYQVHLWPRWSTGEPDLVIELFGAKGALARLVVEVKLGAGKSGEDAVASDEATPERGDQLARYLWEAVQLPPKALPTALIYLTSHSTAPRKELERSMAGTRRRGVGAPIAWASWRDLENRLQHAVGGEGPELRRDLDDFVALLRKAGLFRFRGDWRSPGILRMLPRMVVYSSSAMSSFAARSASRADWSWHLGCSPREIRGRAFRGIPPIGWTFRASDGPVTTVPALAVYTRKSRGGTDGHSG